MGRYTLYCTTVLLLLTITISLQSTSGRSRSPALQCRMIFRLTSHQRHHLRPSDSASSRSCSLSLIRTFVPDSQSLHLCGPSNNWHYLGHTKNYDDDEMRCELSLVLSWRSFKFASWLPIVTSYLETGSRLVHKCVHTADETGQNCSITNIWGLLKTVCDCRQLSSHRRQDKTRQDTVSAGLWTRHKPTHESSKAGRQTSTGLFIAMLWHSNTILTD